MTKLEDRLDRAANGLILVAHTKTTAAALSKLFRSREVEKRYRVLVARQQARWEALARCRLSRFGLVRFRAPDALRGDVDC